MATLYKIVNGSKVELTSEELKLREAEEKEWSEGEKDRN